MLLPNAAVLRGAEALDSILNAADAGSPDVPNAMNAGRVLCSSAPDATLTVLQPLAPLFVPRACAVCQLGGLIYFTLLGIIVLVLINFLPLINLFFQLLFDGCVACTDAVTAKRMPGKVRRPASLSRAPSSRVKGAAATVTATASASASASANVSGINLTAQQLRALRRKRRLAADGSDPTSFVSRARALGKRVARHFNAAPAEEARLLPPSTSVSPPAPQETWA